MKLSNHRYVFLLAGLIAGGVLLFFAFLPRKAADQLDICFRGYETGTNGFRLARFALTNDNSFPVRCRLWISPPHTTDRWMQGMFDPEYVVIPERSVIEVRGAALLVRPRLPPYPPATNLPPQTWVLHANVWNNRPHEETSELRKKVGVWLLSVQLDRMARLAWPDLVSFAASDPIPPDDKSNP